eukprot:TRINITY_DN6297_c0_g2_i1.p1 TRINITY_DN6297_c0_g2~~TRINITY_DN6297_c0_g2_i1.p1  ORF type:complete len:536 (+),score=106.25 TRINITY_DN6297_c0_g2_i1:295-1902(+)
MKDIQGLEVTISNPELLTVLNNFTINVLSYGSRNEEIMLACKSDPSSVLINSICAFLSLEGEKKDQKFEAAMKYVQQARQHLHKANARERLYVSINEAQLKREEEHYWKHRGHRKMDFGQGCKKIVEKHDDDTFDEFNFGLTQDCGGGTVQSIEGVELFGNEQILEIFENIVEQWPDDFLAVKLAQVMYFNLGHVKKMLQISQISYKKSRVDNPLRHYLMGMLSFGLVENCESSETEKLREAEEMGRQATQLAPFSRDPWAHHAVAHCLEVQGMLDDGIRWMEGKSHLWEGCNSFMYTHNWWHTALFYLDRNEDTKVVELFDSKIWGVCKENVQDQLGASSLLWRMQIRKPNDRDQFLSRWEDIADYIPKNITEHIQPLVYLHYLYTLSCAGRTERVSEMLRNLKHSYKCEKVVPHSLARGVIAHATGNYEESYENLYKTMKNIRKIGGSAAQLDIFEQTYVDTLLRTKHYQIAKNTLENRIRYRPYTPVFLEQLSESLEGTGQLVKAFEAKEKAKKLDLWYKQNSPFTGGLPLN